MNADAALAVEAVTRTHARIMQSPERIKHTISTMGATASEDKRKLAAHEAKTRELQAKISVLLSIEKLQTIEKEVRALELSQRELADTKDNLDEKKIERTELEMRHERVHKQLENARERLERAQRHVKDKRAASTQMIKRLQREHEEMSLERRDNDRQVEELRSEADSIERKMAEHLKKSEAELGKLFAEY